VSTKSLSFFSAIWFKRSSALANSPAMYAAIPLSLGSCVSANERSAVSNWSAVRPWRAAASTRTRFRSSVVSSGWPETACRDASRASAAIWRKALRRMSTTSAGVPGAGMLTSELTRNHSSACLALGTRRRILTGCPGRCSGGRSSSVAPPWSVGRVLRPRYVKRKPESGCSS